VKEVTGIASYAFAPATLAGRGVIGLIGADAGIFSRGPKFLLEGPGGSRQVEFCAECRRHLRTGAKAKLQDTVRSTYLMVRQRVLTRSRRIR
jgi:hypothetical protein